MYSSCMISLMLPTFPPAAELFGYLQWRQKHPLFVFQACFFSWTELKPFNGPLKTRGPDKTFSQRLKYQTQKTESGDVSTHAPDQTPSLACLTPRPCINDPTSYTHTLSPPNPLTPQIHPNSNSNHVHRSLHHFFNSVPVTRFMSIICPNVSPEVRSSHSCWGSGLVGGHRLEITRAETLV